MFRAKLFTGNEVPGKFQIFSHPDVGLVGSRDIKLPSPVSIENDLEDNLTSLGDHPTSQDDCNEEECHKGSWTEARMTTLSPHMKEEDRMIPDVVGVSSITPSKTGMVNTSLTDTD